MHEGNSEEEKVHGYYSNNAYEEKQILAGHIHTFDQQHKHLTWRK